jgi:hypothetical protein
MKECYFLQTQFVRSFSLEKQSHASHTHKASKDYISMDSVKATMGTDDFLCSSFFCDEMTMRGSLEDAQRKYL